jgi:hypothetical protein
MTPSQIKALTILKDTSYSKPFQAAEFALKMWPDSDMHRKTSNQGNGACVGKAAWLCAGSYLGKLYKKGWIATCLYPGGYYITSNGRAALSGIKWACPNCAEVFKTESDLEAHLFNNKYCKP